MSAAPSAPSLSTSEIARATARTSPASTRSDRVAVVTTSRSLVEELARNHEALNLARALADGQQLDVAEILFGRIVFHEAVAAMYLDAVVGGLDRDFTGEEFCHRRFAGH